MIIETNKFKRELGVIELGSEVYVSDPCYSCIGIEFDWSMPLVKGLKAGKYHGFVYKEDFGERLLGGIRVTDFWIAHEDYIKNYPYKILDSDIAICVDSGAAGIYDKEYFEKYHTFENGKYIDDYPESGNWYYKQVKLRDYYDIDVRMTSLHHKRERKGAIMLDDKCFISESGWGDGSYPLYAGKNRKGEIVSLRIKFI